MLEVWRLLKTLGRSRRQLAQEVRRRRVIQRLVARKRRRDGRRAA